MKEKEIKMLKLFTMAGLSAAIVWLWFGILDTLKNADTVEMEYQFLFLTMTAFIAVLVFVFKKMEW